MKQIARATTVLALNFLAAGVVRSDSFNFTIFTYPGLTSYTRVGGINNSGQIVGDFSSQEDGHIFEYSNGSYADVTDPQPCSVFDNCAMSATGINSSGQIIAQYRVYGSSDQSFLYTNGAWTVIPNPTNSHWTLAKGINNSGQIVGTYLPNDLSYYGSFLYANHRATPIAGPPGLDASAINNLGQIAGTYQDSTGKWNIFEDDNGSFVTIPYPSATVASELNVTGFNDSGVIVGIFNATPYSVGEDFIYQNGVFTNVQLPFVAYGAFLTGINDKGEITGNFEGEFGNSHGFLGVPVSSVPEPGSLITVVFGVLFLSALSCRKY